MVKLGVNPKKEDFKGPKKPPSGYFAFGDMHRSAVTAELRAQCEKEGTPFSVKDVSTRLAEMWKEYPAEKKAELEAAYKKKLEIYKVEDAEWKKSEDYQKYMEESRAYDIRKGELAAKKSLKEAGKPKKGRNAFSIFVNERREAIVKQWETEGKAWKVGDVAKVAGPMWKNLSKEEKQPFEERAAKEKAEAEAKLEEFHQSEAYLDYSKKMDELKEKRGDKEVIKEKKPRKPRAPKASATEPTATTEPVEPHEAAAPAVTPVASDPAASLPAAPVATATLAGNQ